MRIRQVLSLFSTWSVAACLGRLVTGCRSANVARVNATSEAERLAMEGILRLRADNPGPLTLSGTNTWVVGRDPAWVVDPGPMLPSHFERLLAALGERGGLGGIAITHDHSDHVECVTALRERLPAPLAAARGAVEVVLSDGLRFGPFEALYTPGHAPDHYALLYGRACFTGDAVLGEGSVFIAPEAGALAGYIDGLERLARREPQVLCPGHGPAIWGPQEHLRGYVEHRLERERRLLAALHGGRRTVAELLDSAWEDVPEALRPAAAFTLAAHLDKLAEEGRLPDGVERPSW
jgi:glyoxylase-like metal-dependent hydrolase (beta-lactamase superfamily II)